MANRVEKAGSFYQRLDQRQIATATKRLFDAGVKSEKLKPEHLVVYKNACKALEKIQTPRCYINPYVAKLINNGCSPDQLQTFVDSALVNLKREWDLDTLSEYFKNLLKARPNEDEWRIYKEAITSHIKQKWFLTGLIGSLIDLVKSKPNKKERELYEDILSYYKKHCLPDLEKMTSFFASLVKARPNEDEYQLLNDSLNYQKTHKRRLSDLIWGFGLFASVSPTQEERKIFKELLDYYMDKERKWDIGHLSLCFGHLVKSKPTEQDLEIYKGAINLFKEDAFYLNEFTLGFSELVEAKASPLIYELFITAFNYGKDIGDELFIIKDSCRQLAMLNPPRATIRNSIEAIKKRLVKSDKELLKLVGETAVHSSICALVSNSPDSLVETARDTVRDVGEGDSPPYSFHDEKNKIRPEVQKMYNQTLGVYRRAFNVHHGFSSLTFDTKRPPNKEPALLMRFGRDVGRNVEYINARDVNLFPGRGLIISGLIPHKIFAADSNAIVADEDPYKKYKDAWGWAKGVFDDLPKTKFIFTRGFIALSVNDSKYELTDINGKKVNYSYVVFNDHHHNYENAVAFLVPTELLEKKMSGVTIPYSEYNGPSTKHVDINDVGFKIEDLILDARTIPANVLNIGWGSNLSGGLCNSYPLDSMPYHSWEIKERKKGATCDVYGHVHKSYLNGIYVDQINRTHEKRFQPLIDAHNQVFEVTSNYQNLLDLFRIAFALWHKGQTLGEEISPFDESFDDLFEKPKFNLEDQLLERNTGEDAASNINSSRMLVEAYKWHQIGKSETFNRNDFPILVKANALDWWGKPDSPFYLDTFDMAIDLKEKEKIILPDDSNGLGSEEAFVWTNQILPYASGTLSDVRFYDRRDLGIK